MSDPILVGSLEASRGVMPSASHRASLARHAPIASSLHRRAAWSRAHAMRGGSGDAQGREGAGRLHTSRLSPPQPLYQGARGARRGWNGTGIARRASRLTMCACLTRLSRAAA